MLLAGPSGSGKTHLAEESGLPLLDLDHFYKDGYGPHRATAPDARHRRLGRSAVLGRGGRPGVLDTCRTGFAEVPVYDISRDARVGTRGFDIDEARAFVGTGIFAAESSRRPATGDS